MQFNYLQLSPHEVHSCEWRAARCAYEVPPRPGPYRDPWSDGATAKAHAFYAQKVMAMGAAPPQA